MAQEEVKIFFKVEGLDGYITDLGDLKTALGQVDNETKEATAATEELTRATEQGAAMSEARMDALEGGVKVLAGAAEIAAGAFALLGDENNEFFKATEKNVLGVIALGQGLVNVTEGYRLLKNNMALATAAQRIMNTVAKANPYVLLATALLAAGGAMLAYSIATDDAMKAVTDLADEQERSSDALAEQHSWELKLAKARGEDTGETAIIQKQQQIALLTRQIAENRRAEIQAIKDGETGVIQPLRDAARALKNEKIALEKDLEILETTAATKARQAAEKAAQTEEDAAAATKASDDAAKRANRKSERDQKEADDLARIALEKKNAADAVEEIAENQAALEEELFQTGLTDRERETRAIEDAYYERLNLAEGNAELIKQVEDQFTAEKKAATDKFNAEDVAAAKVVADEKIRIANEEASARQDIANKAFSVLGDVMTLFQKDGEENAEKNFNANKKAGIAQAVVNTALAVGGALTAGGNPLKLATGAQFVEAGIAAIAGAAQVAAISRTTFNGGGEVGGGGGGGIGAAASINYNVGGQQAGPEVGLPNESIGGGGAGATQTYVLAGDVTSAQNAAAQIENLARL